MKEQRSFAVWLTGLPASGKSMIARSLANRLFQDGLAAVVLESDTLRQIVGRDLTYSDRDRDQFYERLACLGALIASAGVPVIFDATAHLRRYRDAAKSLIPRVLEVLVDTPIEICRARDPKGLYAAAAQGTVQNLPGTQAAYEPPYAPHLTVDGQDDPEHSAELIMAELRKFLYV